MFNHRSSKKSGGRNGRSRGRRGKRAQSLLATPSSPTHTYILPYQGPTISVFGNADPLAGGSLSFEYRLADLTQASTYTALYDMYRINWVEIEFSPGANFSAMINATEPPGGTNPAYTMPSIHTALDYGSASSPLSVNSLLGFDSYRRAYLDRPYKRRLVLRGSVQVSNPGTVTPTTGALQPLSNEGWFSCQYPLLKFGNMLVFVDPVSSQSVALTPLQVRTWCRMSVSFKNVV